MFGGTGGRGGLLVAGDHGGRRRFLVREQRRSTGGDRLRPRRHLEGGFEFVRLTSPGFGVRSGSTAGMATTSAAGAGAGAATGAGAGAGVAAAGGV